LGEHRNGRIGIFSTLVLLVSIVLFLGSNFYLTTTGPWASGPMFGREKYDSPFIPEKQTETQPQIDQQELNLTMAVADLENEGCVFTVYTREYVISNVIKLDYYSFREKAINRKIVFLAEEQDITILLVEKKGQLYKWSPYACE
jgi:hypothetical protein